MRTLLVTLLLLSAAAAVLLWMSAGEAPAPPSPSVGPSVAAEDEAAAPPPAQPQAEPARTEAEPPAGRFVPPALPARPEGLTLHGRVVDAVSGQPIGVFRTWLAGEGEDLDTVSRNPARVRLHANPLGTFTYHGLKEGRYDLLVRTETHQDAVVRGIALPQGDEPLLVRLSRGAWIEVTTTDLEGDGEGGLEVRIDPLRLEPHATPPRVRLRFTDDHGRALFTNLPPGAYRVALANAALASEAQQEVVLGPGGSQRVTFRLPDLVTVEVSARDTQDHPLGLVQVRLWSKDGKGIFRAETDARGRARIRHVPAGEYTVKVYKWGFRRRTFSFSVPEGYGTRAVPLEIELTADPAAAAAELNPTKEQLERLKRGERPSEVFGGDG